MPKRRLSLSCPFLNLTSGTLKAECEREYQHNQAEETHRPKDEQRDY